MKFTMLLILMWYYLYLYNITSFCFPCSKLCSNCYCYSILPFKRCYIKRLTFKGEIFIPYSDVRVLSLGSGSVFRVFGILGILVLSSELQHCCRLLQAKGRPRRTNTNCSTYTRLSCRLQLNYNYLWINTEQKDWNLDCQEWLQLSSSGPVEVRWRSFESQVRVRKVRVRSDSG